MEMVCGFAWFGWAALSLVGLGLSVIAVGILLDVIRRWRRDCREYAAYRIGYEDGTAGLQPLPGRRRRPPRAGRVSGWARPRG